jgi:hypothetical protein
VAARELQYQNSSYAWLRRHLLYRQSSEEGWTFLSLSLSRLFGLYGKGMTIEHRGLRGARGSEGGFMAAIDDEMLQRFALRLNFHES